MPISEARFSDPEAPPREHVGEDCSRFLLAYLPPLELSFHGLPLSDEDDVQRFARIDVAMIATRWIGDGTADAILGFIRAEARPPTPRAPNP